MYTTSPESLSIVPPVIGAATIAVLPATGADIVTTLAGAVLATLVTWGVIYLTRIAR